MNKTITDQLQQEVSDNLGNALVLKEKREAYFKAYFDFAFSGIQLTTQEENELKSKDIDILTFNHSEDYFEEYISKLFPRNPQTGSLDVGVSVIEDDIIKRSEYEDIILQQYTENKLPDLLLEQGQNFLIGGSAALYYPPDGFGGVNIFSIDPRQVFLGWVSNLLQWVAWFDSHSNTYTYITPQLVLTLDNNKAIINVKENVLKFIPFSWIPNMPKAHSREGKSKIASIANLDKSYNKTMTNYGKRTDENTSPHQVVSGDGVKRKELRRGKGKTTVLPAGAKMDYLELKEGKEILDFAQKMEDKIRSKTGLIDTQGVIKSAISGASLQLQFAGILDKIAFMRVYWDQAFKDLNYSILLAHLGSDKLIPQTKPNYNSSVVEDPSQKVTDTISQVDSNIMSRRRAIDSLRGSENSEQELEEIVEEKNQFPELSENNNSAKVEETKPFEKK